jgi:hypothetical protein
MHACEPGWRASQFPAERKKQRNKELVCPFWSYLLFIQNRILVHVLKCMFLGCEEEEEEAVTEARERSAVLFYLDAA